MLRNPQDNLAIREAADFLEVSLRTLGDWDRTHKLEPARHQLNGFELDRPEGLKAFLRTLAGAHAEVTTRR